MTLDRLQVDLAQFLRETQLVIQVSSTSTRAVDIAKTMIVLIKNHPDIVEQRRRDWEVGVDIGVGYPDSNYFSAEERQKAFDDYLAGERKK